MIQRDRPQLTPEEDFGKKSNCWVKFELTYWPSEREKFAIIISSSSSSVYTRDRSASDH